MARTMRSWGLLTSTAVAAAVLQAVPEGAASAATAVVTDGASAGTAAASCWEIKQDNPGATDGSYWLLTPAMSAPAQFYCDMATDGGGWVLIGKGREGWTDKNEGKGSAAALRTAGLSPMSGATSQYSAQTINGLLNNGRVDALADGIRLKRARDAAGSTWQEARFSKDKGDRWVWTFGAEHRVASFSFDGAAGSGGLTSSFGRDNGYQRVDMSAPKSQGYTIGFSYGSGVAGTNSSSTYLWSASNGTGGARPYTEMYLRPHLHSVDAGFTRIPDAGTAASTNVPVAQSLALNSPWGVTGLANPLAREGDVEVQAFTQIGSTMYVGGNFRYVQKTAGSTGADKVDQPFLAAFNVADGELVRTFTPKLNASVEALAALPNGKLLAAGRFSQANGQAVTAVVALDPATGATAPGFAVKVENRLSSGVLDIRAVAVKDGWLYLGGAFTHLTGATGSSVYARGAARINATTGMPGTGWNPEFNGSVVSVGASADGGRLYAAGYFSTSAGAPAYKAAAVLTSANANLATPAWTPTWSSSANYQQAIGEVGSRVWVGGSEHSFFSFDKGTFTRLSGNIGKAHGDYQAMAAGTAGMVYGGCHCTNWNYSNAYTWPNVGTAWTEADSINWVAAYDAATGAVVPSFTPTMNTRGGSGVWALSVDSSGTLWAGGDITTAATPSSAGRWAGGFARFAQTDATAPTTPANLALSADAPATAKLTWNAATDNGGSVSYQVLRDSRVVATTSTTSLTVPKGGENRFFVRATDPAGNLSASSAAVKAGGGDAAPVAAFTATPTGLDLAVDASASTDDGSIAGYAWDFGDGGTGTGAAVTHTYAQSGSYEVRLRVTDNAGNVTSLAKDVTVAIPAPADAYGAAVYGATPDLYWRLNEPGGTTALDSSASANPGSYSGSTTRGVAGAIAGTQDAAVAFDGSSGMVAGNKATAGPTTYSLELWFKTTTTQGGKLIGFGDQPAGLSNSYDRHVYMRNDGTLTFGTWTGAENTITTTAAYNDGTWHHLVATQSAAGMVLYLDGASAGTNPQAGAQDYTGYWRIGGDRTWGGAGSSYFNGSLDEVAVYGAALGADTAVEHYRSGSGTPPPPNIPPEASIRTAVDSLTVTADASGSTDADGTIAAYAWDFGDGATASTMKATHQYAGAGQYTVTLRVTDNKGATGQATAQVTATAPAAPVDTVVVAPKAAWSWRYEAGAPASNWKAPGFDASAWAAGNGILGFGITGLGTNIDISGPASARPLTAYFRKQFTLASAAKVVQLTLNTAGDDGVVVYVNGTEVGRANMPTGTITDGSYALTARRASVANASPLVIDVPVALLVDGSNTIAAETHLNYRATPDVSFDLNATASIRP
ncbi:PKD domain-containing protein [Arthrobacter sp. STN4]|uniref:PKD domain-containing protein n=1 Tax=Arthrobacter sp. STN4 TaxID=2923276 RepID=UPI00211AA397|nr:PKD domain-containing protein [Arthrobacter sp. STN4]MCQ9163646.1 PKD domain-containing protein [Arthrobacter sp. STN4]